MGARKALDLSFWATASTVALCISSAVAAQTAPPPATQAPDRQATDPAASQGAEAEDAMPENAEIVVTGTRRNDLRAADSPTPIDIISSQEILNQASSDGSDRDRHVLQIFFALGGCDDDLLHRAVGGGISGRIGRGGLGGRCGG